MGFRRLFLLFIIIVSANISSAEDSTQPQKQLINGIAAIVNGDVITLLQVRELLASQEKATSQIFHGAELEDKIRIMYQQAVSDLVDRALILQEFKKKEFTIPDYIIDESLQKVIRDDFGGDRSAFVHTIQTEGLTMARFRELQKDKIIVQAMRQSKTSNNIIVSPIKMREYYDSHKNEYSMPEQVKLRMIVLQQGAFAGDAISSDSMNKKQIANEIREKLASGAAFDRLAQMYSDDSSKESGGDWGWIERKTLNDELAKVAFSLKKGEISPVIALDNSYYILMVEDKKYATIKPFCQVQPEIANHLAEQEKLKEQNHWLQSLREKAYIQLY